MLSDSVVKSKRTGFSVHTGQDSYSITRHIRLGALLNLHAPTGLAYRRTARAHDSAPSAIMHIGVNVDAIVSAERLTGPAGAGHASAVHTPVADPACYSTSSAITYVAAKIDANDQGMGAACNLADGAARRTFREAYQK
jgi:hypothetical protein